MAKFKKDSEYPRFNTFSELKEYASKERERLGKSDSWYFELRDHLLGIVAKQRGIKSFEGMGDDFRSLPISEISAID